MSDAKQFPRRDRGSNASESARSSSARRLANPQLQAGLLALKQKDYAGAIAQLEAVCQTVPESSDRLKAEMGLVKAYVRTQQPQKAIVLCQALCRSQNPQVQNWATQTLSDLEHRYGMTVPLPLSGEAATATDWTDETGFVPLGTDSTGFMPSAAAPQETSLAQPILPPDNRASRRPLPRQTAASPDPLPNSSPDPLPNSLPDAASPRSPEVLSSGTAQRLQKWSSLGTVNRSSFWALQAGTIVLLVWWLCALISYGRDRITEILLSIRFSWLNLSLWVVYFEPFWGVVIGLTLLFFASPWLLDGLLKACYGIEDLRRSDLESFSPEAVRLLKRVTGSHSLPFPRLKRLPTAVPLCFTYGYLPRHARIVVSQGLLERLEPDEIAALLAAEWAHVMQWDAGILSLLEIITLLPYLLYESIGNWGDRQSSGFLQGSAIALSSLSYGIYWLLRLPALLLSRIRHYYSDRTAAELTGNPNGLARALLKLTIGMAETVAQHGSTPPLLESLNLLLPVGDRQSLTLGTVAPEALNLLEWDCRQPYRPWLNALHSHPLLGDRLSRLMNYGRQWRLEPQIEWQAQPQGKAIDPKWAQLYFAPFLGILAGWLLAGLLWAIGFMAKRLGWLEIDWMWADWSVVTGLGLLGFSLGTFLRINAFFPDIKRSALRQEPTLTDWLSDPTALPIDFHPVQLQGQLLGRRGILNRLHQDLILQTGRGMIRLHYTTRLGFVSDVLFQVLRPQVWIASPAQTVTVVGWFRRGAIPWIDVETIQSQRGSVARSEHPLWSTILGTIAAIAGAYIIFTGGF